MVRLIVLVLVAASSAIAPARAQESVPDLCVRRDGFVRQGDSLLVVVENLGQAPSPPTEIELSSAPFLGGPTGTSSPYRPTSGLPAVWVDQEPASEDEIRLTLWFERSPDPATARSEGEIRFQGTTSPARAEGTDGVTERESGDGFDWRIEIPADGTSRTWIVPAAAGAPARARIALASAADELGPAIETAEGRRHGVCEIVLDCLDRPRARRSRLPVPSLGAGERVTVRCAASAGALGETWVRVDPDDEIGETLEGNNISGWHADRNRWTIAGLHLHSCFSEGNGSFDWQAWHAAMSGYDLTWWSEHDWRISCRDHVRHEDFENAAGEIEMSVESEGEGAGADYVRDDAAEGRSFRLFTGSDGGAVFAEARTDRKRFAYSLASEVDVELRLFARDLGESDVVTIRFELSRHPGARRSLRYELRRDDVESTDRADPAWSPVVRRMLPTGSWVTIRLPLSRDAQAAWPNGLDDNLLGMWIELTAAGAAELRVDELRIEHRRCGEELLRVEEEWTRAYPNLRHEVGGEVSYRQPHLARYGGDPYLLSLDLERIAGSPPPDSVLGDAERIVPVVHARSGVVSWCHPLGAKGRKERSAELFGHAIDRGMAGVDAVEVGYRQRAGSSLRDYLDLWDEACRDGVVVTALGVNDSHGADWAPWENNFATWLDAPADDTGALLRAMREGRAFFGDPVRFRGRVSIDVNGASMGGIVGGEGPRAVRIRLSDAGENRTVRLIGDGAILREWTGVSGSGVLGEPLDPGRARSVRAEVWTADEEPLAFTNPVFLDSEGTLRRGDR